MTQEHPITPSIELVKQWSDRWHSAKDHDYLKLLSLLLPPKPPAGALINS
jgi:hypothetical protein